MGSEHLGMALQSEGDCRGLGELGVEGVHVSDGLPYYQADANYFSS
jgi:hypothetical protein